VSVHYECKNGLSVCTICNYTGWGEPYYINMYFSGQLVFPFSGLFINTYDYYDFFYNITFVENAVF